MSLTPPFNTKANTSSALYLHFLPYLTKPILPPDWRLRTFRSETFSILQVSSRESQSPEFLLRIFSKSVNNIL